MNTGRQQSLLDCRVAVRAIRNEEAQKRVVSQQFNLVDSYKKGDLVNVMTIFRDLKDIAQQEQDRLLHLLSLLHDKHCNIGGYEFLRELPEDFDSGHRVPWLSVKLFLMLCWLCRTRDAAGRFEVLYGRGRFVGSCLPQKGSEVGRYKGSTGHAF